MEDGCGSCANRGLSGSFHIPESRFYEIAGYEWHRDGRDRNKLAREGREDYWEGLIHFCKRPEFVAIFEDGRIKAAATGYYCHTKASKAAAVCLTETPLDQCKELTDTHGPYGYVFSKRDIIRSGGAPAIYLPVDLIRAQERAGGFAPELIPFVNLIRIPSVHPGKSKIDYLHEREWRVAGDIDLKTVVPFGVIIPGRTDYEKFRGPGWETLLAAASRFEEIDVVKGVDF
jgi:hypothetical protein